LAVWKRIQHSRSGVLQSGPNVKKKVEIKRSGQGTGQTEGVTGADFTRKNVSERAFFFARGSGAKIWSDQLA